MTEAANDTKRTYSDIIRSTSNGDEYSWVNSLGGQLAQPDRINDVINMVMLQPYLSSSW